MRNAKDFKNNVNKAINNTDLQKNLPLFLNKVNSNRITAAKQFSNLDLAKHRASFAKWKVTEHLDKYLVDFEANVVRKGGKVYWAHDIPTALLDIESIINKNKAKVIFKTKNLIADEIGLNDYFKSKNTKIVDTDFGDYILNESKEEQSHLIYTTFLADKKKVENTLNEKIRVSLGSSNKVIAKDLRTELRKSMLHADIAITDAQFLIADNGMVALCENEGNARMAMSLPKTHIVLAGIDKIIPSISDIELFFPLYASFTNGQKLNTYNTITGPKNQDDKDGPDEFIVILVDNGRSNILAAHDEREILSCIDCGACYNVCPVFKNTGNQSYETTYAGPIGSAKMPLMAPIQQEYLSNASTNCGQCNAVCPVNIDLQNHIIRNRRNNQPTTSDKIIWFSWKSITMNRKSMNKSPLKGFTFKKLFKSDWGNKRELPTIADKTFNELWREKNGLK